MDTEWDELYSEKHLRKYWKHKVDGKISWKVPFQSENEGNNETKSVSNTLAAPTTTAEEWIELFSDKHNKKYWKNKTTGKTSWSPPLQSEHITSTDEKEEKSLAVGDEWEELFSEKHKRKYWKNKSTGKTSWTAPERNAPAVNSLSNVADTASAENSTHDSSNNVEWEELYSEKHKKKYWKNKSTGKSSWTDPATLKEKEAPTKAKPAETAPPSGHTATAKVEVEAGPVVIATEDEWEELFNQKHQRKYWKNKSTGKSSWTNPNATSAAVSAVGAAVDEEKAKTETSNIIVSSNPAAIAGAKGSSQPIDVATDASSHADESATAASEGEWQESFSKKHGKKFWKNSVTGKTSWAPPTAKSGADSKSTAAQAVANTEAVEVSLPAVAAASPVTAMTAKATVLSSAAKTLPPTAVAPVVAPIVTVRSDAIAAAATTAESVTASFPNLATENAAAAATSIVSQPSQRKYEYIVRGCAIASIVALDSQDDQDNAASSSSSSTLPSHWSDGVSRTFFELRSNDHELQLELKSLDLDLEGSNHKIIPFTTSNLFSNMKSVKNIKFEDIRTVVCNQSYGEIVIEVGESKEGFICTLKFYSLKFAQLWFELLQARAASFSKYSAVAFTDKSHDSTPWKSASEEVDLLLAMHSLDLENKYSLLAEAQWVRSSSIVELDDKAGEGNLALSSSSSSLRVEDLIDHTTLILAKIKSCLFQPSSLSGASKIQPRHGSMRRSIAQASQETKDHHDLSCSFQGVARLGIASKQPGDSYREVVGEEEWINSAEGRRDDEIVASEFLWSQCSLAVDRHDHLLYVLDYGKAASSIGTTPALRRGGRGGGIAFDFVGASVVVEDLERHARIRVMDVKVASMSKDLVITNPDIMKALNEGYVDIGIDFCTSKDFFLFCAAMAASVSTFHLYRFGSPVELSLDSRIQVADRDIQHTVNDVISEITTALSERTLISSHLRRSKINGKRFRTAKFVELNDRVVVVDSGDCQVELPSGSVIISVNGLSTRHKTDGPESTSTSTSSLSPSPLYSALNFIADFPTAMTATVQLIRFPAARFLASVCIPPSTLQTTGDEPSIVWTEKTISIESGFIQLLGRASYPASSCNVATKLSFDSESDSNTFIAEISDKKTGKILFSVSCPHSDCENFLSLIEALHVAVYSHTQSWKALALTLERSEQNKPVKRRVGLTQPIHTSIQSKKSEDVNSSMQNSMQYPLDENAKEKQSNAVKFSIYRAVGALEGTLSALQLPSISAQFPSAESVLVAMTEIAAIQAHNLKMVAELMVWQHRGSLALSSSSSEVPSVISAMDHKGDSEPHVSTTSDVSGPPEIHVKRLSSKPFSQILDVPSSTTIDNLTQPPPATLDRKALMLGPTDRKHISNIIYWLIRSPKTVVSICKRLKSATEVESFAHVIASRLLHPCSTEPTLLGSFIGEVAAIEPTEGEHYLVNSKANRAVSTWARNSVADRFDHSQLLRDRLLRPVLLLPYIVVEMGRHFEVVSFVRHVCSETVDAFVDGLLLVAGTHVPQVAVLELTAKIVEPVCNQFYLCIAEGVFPSCLQTVAVALTRSASSSEHLISANAAVAEFIVPNVIQYVKRKIAQKLRYIDDSKEEDGSNEKQTHQLIQRLKYLFYLTFGAALDTYIHSEADQDKFSLCLADVAALSRSKWFIARAMEAIHTSTSPSPTHSTSEQSPVGALAQFNTAHGRMEVMYGVVCMLPSEVVFLLSDVLGVIGDSTANNAVQSALAAVADSVEEALSCLSSSEQIKQLHRFVRVDKMDLDRCAAYCFNTHSHCLLYDAVAAALHPDLLFLDSKGHILQDSDADLSSSSSSSDFEVDRDRKESFSRLQGSAQDQLTNMGWLVSAARATLRAVQQQQPHENNNNNAGSQEKASAEEILELNRSLQSKQGMILATFQDLDRVQACRAWCQNLGSQIRVVLESFRTGASLDATKDATLKRLLVSQIQWDNALRNDEGRSAQQLRSAQKLTALNSSAAPPPAPAMQQGRPVATENFESKTDNYTTPFKVIGKNGPGGKGRLPLEDGNRTDEKLLSVGGPNPLWILMQNVFPSPRTKF